MSVPSTSICLCSAAALQETKKKKRGRGKLVRTLTAGGFNDSCAWCLLLFFPVALLPFLQQKETLLISGLPGYPCGLVVLQVVKKESGRGENGARKGQHWDLSSYPVLAVGRSWCPAHTPELRCARTKPDLQR